MRWSGVGLCTRDGGLKAGPLRGWCHPKNLLVLICDAKTWSPKKENKNLSDTGLFLCADWVLDFVQEVGDQGVWATKESVSLKKKIKEKIKMKLILVNISFI